MKIYNKKLPQKLIDELYYLNEAYFQFDKPVPFIEGLTLYPVNVKFHDEFLTCSSCFTLNKLDDPMGLMYSNMGYLISKMQSEDKDEGAKWSRYFSRLCELIFNIKNGIKCKDCGKIMSFSDFFKGLSEEKENFKCECGSTNFMEVIGIKENEKTHKKELRIDGVTVTDEDFNRLRQIVMYQNLPDFKDDSWVDIEVRKDQEETARLRAKKNKAGSASLERKICCMAVKMSVSLDYVYSLTIRKFLMMFSIMDDLINYETTRIGLSTGMISTKEPIEHWVFKPESDDLYGVGVDAQAFKDQITSTGQA